MALLADERAQSIQVGAVLLFAILILAFSTYQAVIVPDQNRRVEFDHNQEVQSQLGELRDDVLASQADGSTRSATVDLGTNYPARALGMNPSSPSGTLRTVGTTDPAVNLTIHNATAGGEVGDQWDGSVHHFDTGAIEYDPEYHNYDDAPTTGYEHTVLYNAFDGDSLVLANQSFIQGTDVSFVTLDGSIQRTSSTATTVDTRPLSSSDRTITVSAPSDSSPITLDFTSQLSVDRWRTILSGQEYVENVTGFSSAAGDDFTGIRVTLNASQTYDLELTKAGVGTGLSGEDPAYITDVAGDGSSVAQGHSQQLTLEVRDRYNNPVQGVTVNGSVGGGNLVSSGPDDEQETSDSDGQVRFTYRTNPSTVTGTHAVNFTTNDDSVLSSGSFDAGAPENATMDVTVTTAAGGGGGGAYILDWTNPSNETDNGEASLTTCDADSCTWDVGASADDTLTLNATLEPQYEGIDVEYAVDDTTVASVSPTTGSTIGNGANQTELIAADNGTVEVLASSNDGSGVIEIQVDNVTGSGDGSESSDQMAAVPGSGSTFWGGGGVAFEIENTGSGPVTISALSVDSTSVGSAAQVAEGNGGAYNRGQHEAWFDVTSGTDGVLDVDGQPYSEDDGTPLSIGTTESLTEDAVVDGGTTATVELYEFQNGGGNAQNMAGSTVTVTLTYGDGSTDTFQVNP